jgi:hypothetical protein
MSQIKHKGRDEKLRFPYRWWPLEARPPAELGPKPT